MAVMDKPHRLVNEDSAHKSPPNFEHRMYSPHTIAAVVAELEGQGVDPVQVLEGTGLAAPQLSRHTTKISYRQLDQVIRNAIRLSNDPAMALHAGQRMHITAYGMYGYALLSSATHAEARDFAIRYMRVIGPFCDCALSLDDATISVAFEPMHWPNPTDNIHRFAVEFALSAHLTATRDRIGSHFAFSRVLLDYPPPPYADTYDRIFQCPILFRQPGCSYEHVREDRTVELADPRTHAMAREMCEQLLDEINRTGGIAADIRRILIEQPGCYPSIETIAEKLEMYPRALRRKLEAEGTSYRDLLAEVRMRLAIEYLRKTQMTNEEIAGRLGYSDAANFRHAFIRWTGKSPSDFRSATRAP
ncbi:MAG: AraC family transcriptional regulator [Xanthobacteraceae bacterium]|jgi:AraC-like DNA-binding protein